MAVENRVARHTLWAALRSVFWLAGRPAVGAHRKLCARLKAEHGRHIRFAHRSNSRDTHLSRRELGDHLRAHHHVAGRAVHPGTSAVDLRTTLDRWCGHEPTLLCFGAVSRTVAQRRGAVLQDSRRLDHAVCLWWVGANRTRTIERNSGIQYRHRRASCKLLPG